MKKLVHKYIKHFALLGILSISVIAGVLYAGHTQTMSEGSGPGRRNYMALRKRTVVFGDVGDANSETLNPFYGIVLRLTVDVNGTDADGVLSLTDESGVSIFSKTAPGDLSGYAIFEDDTGGDPHSGVAVGGALTLTATDMGDLDLLTVNIYYLEMWQ